MLDDDERAAFLVFSVFATARIDAVEAVAARLGGAGADVVPRLASLVAKSLVRSLDENGHRRLAMLETIRDYAAERLDERPDIRDAARRAHAEYFSELARDARGRLSDRERTSALADLEADLGNLQTAWRYWVGAGDLERLDAMLDALWTLHDDRGWYHGAIALSNDLLAVLSAAPATDERTALAITVRTSLARGLMAILGYTQEVEDLTRVRWPSSRRRESRGRGSTAQESGEPLPVSRGLRQRPRGRAAAAPGRRAPAGPWRSGRRGISASAPTSSRSAPSTRAWTISIARFGLFDPQRHASGRLRLGPSPGIVPYTTSAFVLWSTGHPARAVERGEGALRVAAELRHPYSAAYALFHVAFLDPWRRDWSSVHEHASQVLDIAEEHDYQVWRALTMIFLGVSETAIGDPAHGSP